MYGVRDVGASFRSMMKMLPIWASAWIGSHCRIMAAI